MLCHGGIFPHQVNIGTIVGKIGITYPQGDSSVADVLKALRGGCDGSLLLDKSRGGTRCFWHCQVPISGDWGECSPVLDLNDRLANLVGAMAVGQVGAKDVIVGLDKFEAMLDCVCWWGRSWGWQRWRGTWSVSIVKNFANSMLHCINKRQVCEKGLGGRGVAWHLATHREPLVITQDINNMILCLDTFVLLSKIGCFVKYD